LVTGQAAGFFLDYSSTMIYYLMKDGLLLVNSFDKTTCRGFESVWPESVKRGDQQ